MQQRTIKKLAFFLFLILLISGSFFWTAIGLSFCLYLTLDFSRRIGEEVPIPQLMLLIAALQWILGPWIDYITPETHYLYHMYVPEETYMTYVVPCLFAMQLGISSFTKKTPIDHVALGSIRITNEHPYLPYYLIILGLTVPLIGLFFPMQLAFVFYLLANVKYIGLIYLMFSSSKNKWAIFIGVMLLTLASSVATGMFHDFFLWGILSYTFICREFKMSFTVRLTSILIGALLIITVQAIKPKVRDLTWKGHYQGSELGLFLTLSINEWQSGSILNPSNQNELNVRLNQGWIISKIMNHVPKNESFAKGSTITEAIYATLIPRFLNPDKAIAGGRKNFTKYSGLQLSEGASMGISLAGEGWANYGYFGGIFFLFFWGLFVGWFWLFLQRKSNIIPTLLIWSPLIFQQVIKAETELLDVLNHLVKSAILVFTLLWILKKQFNINV